ncbi:hypothetical protein O9992_01125 [Vibrio lentus]|nr:hypothetical protein [Vibrio lentus]
METVLTLDKSDNTIEQGFVVADGSLYITPAGDIRFEPSRLDHTDGDIVKSIIVTSSDSDSDLVSSTVTLTITDGDINH